MMASRRLRTSSADLVVHLGLVGSRGTAATLQLHDLGSNPLRQVCEQLGARAHLTVDEHDVGTGLVDQMGDAVGDLAEVLSHSLVDSRLGPPYSCSTDWPCAREPSTVAVRCSRRRCSEMSAPVLSTATISDEVCGAPCSTMGTM